MFFVVIETQFDGTNYGILHTVYTDEVSAYAAMYTVLAAAAVSAIPYHSCFIMRDDGILIDGKAFDRREAE